MVLSQEGGGPEVLVLDLGKLEVVARHPVHAGHGVLRFHDHAAVLHLGAVERFGTGNGHPRGTIRIAFLWDAERKKVVVGYIGRHQRTRAT